MKSSTIVIWSIVAVVFLCGLWMLLQRIWHYADATPHPVQYKLTELGGTSSVASFVAPPDADLFNFVIGASQSDAVPNLTGTLTVHSEGKQIHRRTFTQQQLKPCNWLDKYGMKGYVVENSTPGQAVVQLRPGAYSVEIRLEQPAPNSTALWVTFVQSWGSYRKASATN